MTYSTKDPVSVSEVSAVLSSAITMATATGNAQLHPTLQSLIIEFSKDLGLYDTSVDSSCRTGIVSNLLNRSLFDLLSYGYGLLLGGNLAASPGNAVAQSIFSQRINGSWPPTMKSAFTDIAKRVSASR